MPRMIDAMILIHAIGIENRIIVPDRSTPNGRKRWDQARASHALLKDAKDSARFVMSVVGWYEVVRGLEPRQAEWLSAFEGGIELRGIDSKIANRAAALHKVARKKKRLCEHCLGVLKDPATCSRCGSQRSQDQRSGDILMVATADVMRDIDVLYSWDGGVHELARHVSNVHIKEPPPAEAKQMELVASEDDPAVRDRMGGQVPTDE